MPDTNKPTEQATFPFEAMKLRVGDRLQIQPPPQLAQDRHIVRLIGYLPNGSLLVTAPVNEAGFPVQLLEGESIVVRVFSAQNAFGFPAEVLRVCKTPFEYLHLSFPTEVQGMVIRTSPRVKTRIITAITRLNAAEDDKASGILVNLSANGALLDSQKILGDMGETVKIAFKINLHNIDSLLELNAKIRAINNVDYSAQDEKAHIQHGIQFVDLQPHTNMLLQSLIYQQMVEHPETVA